MSYGSIQFRWARHMAPEDQLWALDYLRRKGFYFDPSVQSLAQITLQCTPEADLAAKALQNAWRQRKARKKPGRKNYNFLLSKRTKNELDHISQKTNMTLTDTLERLIANECYEVDSQIELYKKEKSNFKKREEESKKNLLQESVTAQVSRDLSRKLWLVLQKYIIKDEIRNLTNTTPDIDHIYNSCTLTMDSIKQELGLDRLSANLVNHELRPSIESELNSFKSTSTKVLDNTSTKKTTNHKTRKDQLNKTIYNSDGSIRSKP